MFLMLCLFFCISPLFEGEPLKADTGINIFPHTDIFTGLLNIASIHDTVDSDIGLCISGASSSAQKERYWAKVFLDKVRLLLNSRYFPVIGSVNATVLASNCNG